jgi:hypothetical protein
LYTFLPPLYLCFFWKKNEKIGIFCWNNIDDLCTLFFVVCQKPLAA